MDLLSSTQASGVNVTGTGLAASNDEAASVLSSDFETFIRMLTVQMENQDPLNPIESADFSTQLATFSGVEQQVLTNDLLADLGGQLGALTVSQLSGWIGMEGRAVAPVAFDGTPVNLSVAGNAFADTHQLVVRDSNGAEIQRTDFDGLAQDIAWTGQTSDGTILPSGTYQVTVESFSDDALIATNPAQINGRIVEARVQGGETILVMENGQEVAASSLLGLREPR
ncbi:MAG: flagellar hook capping FlgD N-terminal domain-containing protein [Pseudomonadota bacterium]